MSGGQLRNGRSLSLGGECRQSQAKQKKTAPARGAVENYSGVTLPSAKDFPDRSLKDTRPHRDQIIREIIVRIV